MNLHALSYLVLNSENYTHYTDEQIDGVGLQHGLLDQPARDLGFQILFSFPSISLSFPDRFLSFFKTIEFSCILFWFYKHVLVYVSST